MSGLLLFVRHGESEWNAKGIWTGQSDINLSDQGRIEAERMGIELKDITFSHAFTSPLKRTHQTLEHLLRGHGSELSSTQHPEINERDYGELTGKDKWQVKEEIGEENFHGIRRGWDHPVPGGETLKVVYERALPFYQKHILPRLQQGENILVVAHGNTLRALMKYIERLNEEQVATTEMPLGTIVIYKVDADGHATDKEVRTVQTGPSKA